MPLSPTTSTRVTPSRCPRATKGTSPFPALCLLALSLLSFCESGHNLLHADPTSARHGADRGQLAPSAAVIRLLKHLGWVHDDRRPSPARIAARRA